MTTTPTPLRKRTCPRCGSARPIDEDLCGQRLKDGSICGRFLDWPSDDDAAVAAATGMPASDETIDQPATSGRAVIALDATVAGADRRADGLLIASAAPGEQVRLTLTLRNIGVKVRTFTIHVEGHGPGLQLPDWARISDADREVELNPFDHPGPTEGSATVVLAPPVDNHWPAGDYGFAISVRSPDDRGDFPQVTGTLRLKPRFNAVATASPLIATGRRRAVLSVLVLNNGNTDFSPQILLGDAKGVCRFAPRYAALAREGEMPAALGVIPPRGEAVYRYEVRAPLLLIGQPIDHQIKIEVSVAGEEPLPPLLVIFRQRPLIPWWVIPAILALAAIALTLFLLWPRTVTMPVLTGLRSEFRAEQAMTKAGMTAAPKIIPRAQAPIRAGTVLQQNPKAGTRVAPDQAVTLYVAAPPAFTLIPDLVGYTWDRARNLLDHAHLKLGDVLPSKLSRRKVIRQSPRAGRARERGTAVDIVLAGPPLRVVPSIRCLTAKGAQHRLERHGFRLDPVPEFLDPLRQVRDQMPAAKATQKTGREIHAFFFEAGKHCSAAATKKAGGKPVSGATGSVGPAAKPTATAAAVAFDDGHDVRLSRPAGVLGAGRQAAWSPDGRLLALRSGARILVRLARGSPGRAPIATVSTAAGAASMPAFAPVADPSAGVLAFLATPPRGSSRICLAPVVAGTLTPSCGELPGIRARTLAWSPDAATILVTGARPAAPDRPGIVRLQAIAPAVADIGLWQIDGRLLRPRRGGVAGSVFDVAFEPSTRRVAVITDVGLSGKRASPQIVLTPATALRSLRGARWLHAGACQLAFSPDGTRIAAVRPDAAIGCGAGGGLGRLVTFAVSAPHASTLLAARASRPAWPPRLTGVAAAGQP
jgi:beta-lactam-binding protein with PASTA domain